MIIEISIVIAALFLVIFLFLFRKLPKGDEKMQNVHSLISRGASTFLKLEYTVIFIFVILVSIAISLFSKTLALFFFLGSLFSSVAGLIAMKTATSANVKTAASASQSIQKGMRTAFLSGLFASVLTMMLGILGIYILYLKSDDANLLYGFGFGATLVALFMRVGGGIYTKSADIAGDLVGKVEKDLPEDDERNPAVIADLVGDNVGDVAGMGSDLFESYVESIIAAMLLAIALKSDILMPLKIASLGLVSSIFGVLAIRGKNIYRAMLNTVILSAAFLIVCVFLISKQEAFPVLAGLVSGVIISASTIYYTANSYRPTISIAESSEKGAAFTILKGISNGMISIVIPVIVVVFAMVFSYNSLGLYGIALAAVGMLGIVGTTLASSIYGSITDNASGIAEITKQSNLRKRTDILDSAGNTTAAIGKGFAIASAGLTALALLASYLVITKTSFVDLMDVKNISVLFIGVAIPFFFCSMAINAVVKVSGNLVNEVRKQFRNKEIAEGKKRPNYEKCISMTTKSAILHMIVPCLLVILVTILVGLIFGKVSLASLILGSTASSFMLAIFMANAGGSYDNAKKYIESGKLGGKGSDAHKSAVIGDTIGDVFKDTAGPSLNIIIKLVAIVSILFAILF